MGLPGELVERFRSGSLDRVRRVETAWNRVVQDPTSAPDVVDAMLREVHTMKGDAAIVGHREVHQLCQKLEDLLELTAELRGDVSDDLELVVTMALQFITMLLRIKPGAGHAGLDLDGFVRQVDDVLRETRTLMTAPPRPRRPSARPLSVDAPADRLTEQTRQRLAMAATNVFLEYMSARSTTARQRLRTAWTTFRSELSRMQSADLAPVLERHAQAGEEIARALGKAVQITIAVAEVTVEPRVAEAVDIAVLHLIRNAIDHGLEAPAERARANKPLAGAIAVRATASGAAIELTVTDDGAGIDRARVRSLAIERGLLDGAAAVDDDRLLELIFEPGFSTKREVTPLSGRGVGLDAVRSALARVGGRVRVTSTTAGTEFTLTVPAPVRHLHAYHFLGPGGQVSLAVSARWTPTLDEARSGDAIDLLSTIQVYGPSRQTSVHLTTPVRDMTMRLRWGFLDVALRAGTEPRLVVAERICPTSDEHPIEVISVDGQETLLIRPEHVREIATAR